MPFVENGKHPKNKSPKTYQNEKVVTAKGICIITVVHLTKGITLYLLKNKVCKAKCQSNYSL